MSTDKYELEEVAYGTPGWNGILTANHQKVDDNLHTFLLITLGETVLASEALYISTDGKWYKAKADVQRQPSWGLAVDAGVLDDVIRLQRIGPFEDLTWTWNPGVAVWLDPTTPGDLTQVKPALNAQFMGMAFEATIVHLQPEIVIEQLGTTTTTTTTTSTTVAPTTTTTTI